MSTVGRSTYLLPAKRLHNCNLNNPALKHQCHKACTHQLFYDTPQRDLYSLNYLLASYMRNDEPLKAWNLFLQMHRVRSDLNPYTFTPVLGACAALSNSNRGRQIHALMTKLGSNLGTIVKTALIDMYSKYGELGCSVRVFDEMGFKDVVSWNAMLSSFLRNGSPAKALGMFDAMRKERVEFSVFTLCSVLKACSSLNALEQGKQVHALVIVMGHDLVVLSTALIDLYSGMGYIDEAMKVYRTLNCSKDEVMQNSLISGCVRNQKYDLAMYLMSTMKPNIVALTSALAACSENADFWIGKQIHGVALRQGFLYDTQFCNVLLDMYSKCGMIINAHMVFDQISQKDVVSWTSMIDAYGSHGHGYEALELFKKMGEDRVIPNPVTLFAVLSACGHSGLVEQGQEIFALFEEKYGVHPDTEHYACLIDILGRAGKIEEAWYLFDDMVKGCVKPNAAVWAALLNACRLSRDVTRGELAAKQLLELEPNKTANYVALSNFHAAVGRWDAVDMLRSTMRERGIAKEAGSSWVTFVGNNGNYTGQPMFKN